MPGGRPEADPPATGDILRTGRYARPSHRRDYLSAHQEKDPDNLAGYGISHIGNVRTSGTYQQGRDRGKPSQVRGQNKTPPPPHLQEMLQDHRFPMGVN